jgi:hypothetical protein
VTDEKKTPDAGTSGAVVARDNNAAPATTTPESAPQAPAPATWAGLPVPDGEYDGLPPSENVPDAISDNARAIAEWEAERDPPLTHEEMLGMLALCAHATISAVDNLPDGDPSVDPLFVAHLATLVYWDRLRVGRVIDKAATAALEATAKADALADKYAKLLGKRVSSPADYETLIETILQALQALKKRGGLARPVLSAKQPDRHAWFVVREFMRSGRLLAKDERNFFYNGEKVPLATIHAHVRRVLNTACVLNLDKMAEVHVDSHMVNEATIALAQRLHDPGLGLGLGQSEPEPEMRVIEAVPVPATVESPVSHFARETYEPWLIFNSCGVGMGCK